MQKENEKDFRSRVGGVAGTFIFDTGAPVCLTHTFAQKANLTKIREMKFVDSNGQEFTRDLYLLDALKVSDTEFDTGIKCSLADSCRSQQQ